MKKSSTLMLSYIIFLVGTVIIRIRFGWTGIGQVALAATIAGCLFAFADLLNWYISYKKPVVEVIKEDIVIFRQYSDTVEEYICHDIDTSKQAVEIVKIYTDEDERIKEFINACEMSVPKLQQMIEDIENSKAEMDETERELDKDTVKLFGIGVLEAFLAILGFITFFILLCFNSVVTIVVPYGETVTVLAFAIIMLNYFLRDVLEDYAKKDLEDINNDIKQARTKIEEIKENMTEIKYVEAAQKLVELIEASKDLEDNVDGQVEDALGE